MKIKMTLPNSGTAPKAHEFDQLLGTHLEHEERARVEVDRVLKIAREFGVDIQPTIDWKLQGLTAGYAWWAGPKENHISLNAHIAAHERAAFDETVAHEVAHLVTFRKWGNRASAHGAEWRYVMYLFGYPLTKRCHNYKSAHKVRR
jgi:predicted SprT family Zn-dependent metalloprotease